MYRMLMVSCLFATLISGTVLAKATVSLKNEAGELIWFNVNDNGDLNTKVSSGNKKSIEVDDDIKQMRVWFNTEPENADEKHFDDFGSGKKSFVAKKSEEGTLYIEKK